MELDKVIEQIKDLNESLGADGLGEIADGEQPVDTLLAMMLETNIENLPEILADNEVFIMRALNAERNLNRQLYSAFSGHSRYSYDASIGIVYLWLTIQMSLRIRVDLSIDKDLSELFG